MDYEGDRARLSAIRPDQRSAAAPKHGSGSPHRDHRRSSAQRILYIAPRRPAMKRPSSDRKFMETARLLAMKGYGLTSPNPIVGAVLLKSGRIIGRGWHRRAGLAHAEIEALRDAHNHGHNSK